MKKIITEKQDLTFLKWAHARSSSGTAGTFLKSESKLSGQKIYYKLSNYDTVKGIIGHECINEIIVDRLLTILGVEHLEYQLIHADVTIDGNIYETWLCASKDFKERGESKYTLEHHCKIYADEKLPNETLYDICIKNGWKTYIDTMLVVDYLILNRDRHGANIEVLRNSRKKTIRIAPLFDHGLSLLCSCYTEEEIKNFDIAADRPCNNFIGSRSTLDNLNLTERKNLFSGRLTQDSKEILFQDIDKILSHEHIEKIWDMLWTRWCYYEIFCNPKC